MKTPLSAIFPRPACRRAFTLIELLTVIAIIGILAAIIIPASISVRQTARAAACKSNLRQIGVALNLYAGDNKGYFPAPRAKTSAGQASPAFPEGDGDWYTDVWMTKLQSYLENRNPDVSDGYGKKAAIWDGVFRCPGKPNWDLNATPGDFDKLSYSMSSCNVNGTEVNRARRQEEFLRPTLTAIVVDSNTGTVFINNNHFMYRDYMALWHKGKDNVLFVDGHVETVAKGGLNYWLVKSADDLDRPVDP
ncbi:hypothetical protein OPIT5_04445 [Opitutaceae bacterium TAV5]|nr:hypothetical protein OPIT5_04445 [Opitutaceae bacterium TAV5]